MMQQQKRADASSGRNEKELLLWEKVDALMISPVESTTLSRTSLNKLMWWKRNPQGDSQQTRSLGLLPHVLLQHPGKMKEGILLHIPDLGTFLILLGGDPSPLRIHVIASFGEKPILCTMRGDLGFVTLCGSAHAKWKPGLGEQYSWKEWWVRWRLSWRSPKPVLVSIFSLIPWVNLNILKKSMGSPRPSQLEVYDPSGTFHCHSLRRQAFIHSLGRYLSSRYCVGRNLLLPEAQTILRAFQETKTPK